MDVTRTTKVLNGFQNSDSDFLKEFLSKYFNPMLGYLIYKLGVPEHIAEDVAQETLQVITQKIKANEYDRARGGRLRDWVFGIARNVARDMRKKAFKEKAFSGQKTAFWRDFPEKQETKKTWDIEWNRYILKYCHLKLRKELRSQKFKIYELYLIKKQPSEEVAKRLNISKTNVYTSASRIRQRLKEIRTEIESRL